MLVAYSFPAALAVFLAVGAAWERRNKARKDPYRWW